MLSDKEYREAQDEFGDEFEAKMGAAVGDVLSRIDLEDELEDPTNKCRPSRSKSRKEEVA